MHFKTYHICSERCLRCGRCLTACPAGAIELDAAGAPQIQTAKCRRCGACKRICRQKAIVSRVRLNC